MCCFDGIQIFSLEVLHQRRFQRLDGAQFAHHGGDGLQSRPLGRAPASFTRDDLVFAGRARSWPHQDRLQQALAADGRRQLFQFGLRELGARLIVISAVAGLTVSE